MRSRRVRRRPASSSTRPRGARSRPMRSSRSRSAIFRAAKPRARRRPIATRWWCTWTIPPSAEGLGRADLPVDTVKRLTCDGSLVTVSEDEEGTPLDVGRKQRTVSGAAQARALGARPRLLVPGLRPQALRGRAPHRALGRGRRDEPRQPHAALLAPSPAAARGRFPDPARRAGPAVLPAAGWARDPAVRLSTGGHAR